MLARTALTVIALIAVLSSSYAQDDGGAAPEPSPADASTPFLEVVFDQVIQREAMTQELAEDPHFESRSEGRVTATIGPSVVELDAEAGRRLLDYDAGREYVIDDEAMTYTAAPILQRVGFLHMEMSNRLKMREALAIAEVQDPSLALEELTLLFGHRIRGDTTQAVTAADDAGRTSFRVGDDEVASWTLSEHRLGDADRAAYDRFLQITTHLHPDARAALVAADRLPSTLRFRWRNVGELDTATWTLVSASRSDARPRGVTGMERSFAGSELAALATSVLGTKPGDVPGPPDRDGFAKSAAEASAAGRHDDAILLLLESSLSNGDSMQAEIEAAIGAPGAQEVVRSLMRVIAFANGQPRAALEQLAQLDRSRFSRPHVLDVFRANALTAAHREGEAKDLLLEVLSSVPYLVAAYKDLGDLYYGEFQTRDAWLAWEIGRAIHADHPCWEQLDAHEARLRKVYADRL